MYFLKNNLLCFRDKIFKRLLRRKEIASKNIILEVNCAGKQEKIHFAVCKNTLCCVQKSWEHLCMKQLAHVRGQSQTVCMKSLPIFLPEAIAYKGAHNNCS